MVKRHSQYVIGYKGLSNDLHQFDFKVGDKFFEDFENSEIQKGDIDVHVILNKKTLILEFEFDLHGKVLLTCDRCLDEFEMDIEYHTVLYAKFGEENREETDELLILSLQESDIDLSQYIYEYIHLSLPYKRVHPLDKKGNPICNKEMLKRLEGLSINEDKSRNDPRWDDLKRIFNNN